MIQILPCPGCKQPTLMPDGVSPEATVRCPNCREDFVVGEMLLSQFEQWEVVQDPGAQQSISDSVTVASEDTQTLRESAAIADQEELAVEQEIELEPELEGQVNRKAAWQSIEPITHEQFVRMRRKSSSPVRSLIQIVLGGLSAFPIALLILWYGLGKDVGGMGPAVARYAPWIVPRKFHPYENDSLPMTQMKSDASELPLRGGSGFRRFDDVLPTTEIAGPPTMVLEPTVAPEIEESDVTTPQSQPKMAESKVVAESSTEDGMGGELRSRIDEFASEDASSNNVFAIISETEQLLTEWTLAIRDESPNRKEIAQSVYSGLIQIASAIDALPAGNPVLRTIRDRMQEIGKSVKRQESVQSLVEQGSRYWMGQMEGQAKYSLVALIEIEAADLDGDSWEVTLAPTVPQSPLSGMPIHIPRYLAPSLIGGQRLLVAGVVKSDSDIAPSSSSFTANYLHAL